jgi:hypothetical protein
MALVHRATLSPSKRELVEAWLLTRPWAAGLVVADKVAEYRFDDPAGEVGIETILWLTDDGVLLQTPLTYRAAPLDGAEGFLVGTSEHSVLGSRWVYDGCGDPVWAATLAEAILTGGRQAQMVIEIDGNLVDVPARMQVRGSGPADASVPEVRSVDSVDDGAVTTVVAGPVVLALARVVGSPIDGGATLTGSLGGDDTVHILAAVRGVS